MIKKVLILLSSLFMFSCTNVATDGVDETKEDQMARLLEEANKVKTVKVEKTVINDKGEEVVVEEEQAVADQDKRSHKGMTRGEIMEYEMTRVSEEMNALQEEVKQSQEKKTQLKSYQEKLENLKRLNEAGIR
mgnify:CR=1 FL=1